MLRHKVTPEQRAMWATMRTVAEIMDYVATSAIEARRRLMVTAGMHDIGKQIDSIGAEARAVRDKIYCMVDEGL